jgi:hypothetical protein
MSPAYFTAIDTADIESNMSFDIDHVSQQVYRYCTDCQEALLLKNRLQSLGGVKLECNRSFLYAVDCDLEQAVRELESEGFVCDEIV